MWLGRTLHPLNNKQRWGKGWREVEQFGNSLKAEIWHRNSGTHSSRTDRLMEEKRGFPNDLWAEGRVLSNLHNLFTAVSSASSTKDMEAGPFKYPLWEKWMRLPELSQRLLTSPGASLLPSRSFGPSTGAGAAWSTHWFCTCAEWQLSSHSHIQPTLGLLLLSFIFVFIHPLYCRLVPQTLRRRSLWEYAISNNQLWNILRCLWLPEPIQSNLHGKDETAPHSKRIPHCAGNRRVPHCPAAPSCFLFLLCKVVLKWIRCLYWAFQWDFT